MQKPIFITGNQSKVDYLNRYLGIELKHQKVDQIEIQSLDLHEVVEHKARQAYELIQKPVLVDDTSLEFEAFGRFPGTFIRFLVDEVPHETICRSLDSLSRKATRRAVMCMYDGKKVVFFDAVGNGLVADHPSGTGGYGWDDFFIPDGWTKTRADMDDSEYEATYIQRDAFVQLREYLESSTSKLSGN